jgi:hypothetical protein
MSSITSAPGGGGKGTAVLGPAERGATRPGGGAGRPAIAEDPGEEVLVEVEEEGEVQDDAAGMWARASW